MNVHARGCRAQRSGFTLVELLVVIAIIALLVSLLLPALAGARDAAKAVQCLTNLRTAGQAIVMYQNDNGGSFPVSSHTTGSISDGSSWITSLEAHGVTEAMRKCPMDPARAVRVSSYLTNDHFEPLVPGIDYNPFTGRTLPGGRRIAYTRIFQIPAPSETVYAAEAAGEGAVDHLHSIGWTSAADIPAWIAVERHRGGANYLFADGHATAISWARLRAAFSPETSLLFDPETHR
jgi:prepilin-type N-terminal cleavage/methylation domain-containing protein/prepilin-type processing-associated H-X9-DG protein